MPGAAKPLISVIDDDRRILESLEDLLESAGFSVRTFQSARAFLDSDALQTTTCLICDIHMPVVDGRELLALARRQIPALPAILITSHEVHARGSASEPQHPYRLFMKPFDGEELVAAIRGMLGAA